MAAAGHSVHLFDAMPSPGRKFLIAGKGGLNITHSEPFNAFLSRYGDKATKLKPFLERFSPEKVREWAKVLGVETFIGTSGRVFPQDMKAAPLLFSLKKRLEQLGVITHYHHRWVQFGIKPETLLFHTPDGDLFVRPKVCLFALGGASWPFTGSTGEWVAQFEKQDIRVNAFKPANCGFDLPLSQYLVEKFDGAPIKTVAIEAQDTNGNTIKRQGEFIITPTGFEGSLIYSLSSVIRNKIEQNGQAEVFLDLLPDVGHSQLVAALSKDRAKRSLPSFLERVSHLSGVKLALLMEFGNRQDWALPEALANDIKHLPITLLLPRPIEEAISSAGGIDFSELNEHLMLIKIPGTFCAGEMLDWEAPTGGYLITACLATGVSAAEGMHTWLVQHQ